MKTIAVLNLKGGTAKTVTAATMARCLSAEHGRQVLLIDADQQGNLSQYFGVTDVGGRGNTWTLLTEGAGYWPDFVTPAGPNLDLIPSGMELARADLPGSGARVTAIDELREALDEDGVDAASKTALHSIRLTPDIHSAPFPPPLQGGAGSPLRTPVPCGRTKDGGRETGSRGQKGAPAANQQSVCGGERRKEWSGRSPRCQAGTEQSGISSDEVPRSIAARESVLTFSPHCGASKDYRAFVREYLEGR